MTLTLAMRIMHDDYRKTSQIEQKNIWEIRRISINKEIQKITNKKVNLKGFFKNLALVTVLNGVQHC